MNSALGSGGVRDELSNFGSRDIALSHGMGSVSVTRDLEMARATTDDAAEDLEEEGTDESDMDDVGEVNDESDTAENVDEDIDESDMDDVAENVAEISNASDTAENVEEDTNEDDDDAGDGALESRQHSTRLSSSRVRQRPHVAHGPHVAVPSKVAKMTKVMKGKNKLETAGERMVEKKSQQAVKEGGQHVHGA
jgi:hypothetical protein